MHGSRFIYHLRSGSELHMHCTIWTALAVFGEDRVMTSMMFWSLAVGARYTEEEKELKSRSYAQASRQRSQTRGQLGSYGSGQSGKPNFRGQ